MTLLDRALRWLAIAATVGGIACLVAAAVIYRRLADVVPLHPISPGNATLAIAWPVMGVIVVWAHPRNVIGWLMILPAFNGVYQLAGCFAAFAISSGSGAIPVAAWVSIWGWIPAYLVTVPLLPLLFPDGRLPGGRWRIVAYTFMAATIVMSLLLMFLDIDSDVSPVVRNPLGVIPPHDWLRPITFGLAAFIIIGGAISGFAYIFCSGSCSGRWFRRCFRCPPNCQRYCSRSAFVRFRWPSPSP